MLRQGSDHCGRSKPLRLLVEDCFVVPCSVEEPNDLDSRLGRPVEDDMFFKPANRPHATSCCWGVCKLATAAHFRHARQKLKGSFGCFVEPSGCLGTLVSNV